MKVYAYPFPEGTGPMLGELVGEIAEAGRVGFVSKLSRDSHLLCLGASARVRKECSGRGLEVDYVFTELPGAEVFVVYRNGMPGGKDAAIDECIREAQVCGLYGAAIA